MNQVDDALGRVTTAARKWVKAGKFTQDKASAYLEYVAAVAHAHTCGCGDFAIRKATIRGHGQELLT